MAVDPAREVELDAMEAEVAALEREEAEESRRVVEEPQEARRRGREAWCVECGVELTGRQTKRCAPCGQDWQKGYFTRLRSGR